MAIIEVGIIPIGTASTSVSSFIARAVKVLEKEKDIKYELTPMSTIVEGDLGRLLSLVQKMHETAFQAGAMRAVTLLKIDDRRDKASTMASKLASLKRHLESQ
ncbi:MAG: MTH1187 family thiamine-binding protein [Chloroflexi bacterium]|nr:MTH1187 family thiamine-binding protein [Chloroflexota bacterium]